MSHILQSQRCEGRHALEHGSEGASDRVVVIDTGEWMIFVEQRRAARREMVQSKSMKAADGKAGEESSAFVCVAEIGVGDAETRERRTLLHMRQSRMGVRVCQAERDEVRGVNKRTETRRCVVARMHCKRREMWQSACEANLRSAAKPHSTALVHHEDADRLEAVHVQDALPLLSFKESASTRVELAHLAATRAQLKQIVQLGWITLPAEKDAHRHMT